MKYPDALKIGNFLINNLTGACVPGHCVIAGGVRRKKPDVHDLEIVAMPLPGNPRPVFGQKQIDKTYLDRSLRELEEGGFLKRVKGGDKFKQFEIRQLETLGIPQPMNPFKLDLFIVTPPAQWGVQLVIRTGPNSKENNFSQWMVTEKSRGGALPDGYIVQDLVIGEKVVVNAYQKAERKGEIEMPEEEDYFRFCGLPWIEPSKRVARWSRK